MNSNLQKNDDKKSGKRLLSLDTLRGFDMLFIMGAKAKCRIYPDYVIINVNMHC